MTLVESPPWESPQWQEAVRENPSLAPFFDNLESFVELPEGVEKLRELFLRLAVSGKLLPQVDDDEPASMILEKFQARWTDEGGEKRSRHKAIPPIEDVELEVPNNWAKARLGYVFEFEYGQSLPKKARVTSGKIPVYGSNGIVGSHNEAFANVPSIVVGRKGSSGAVNLAPDPFWPIDTTYFVTPSSGMDLMFSVYLLKSLRLDELGSSIVPGLNRDDAYALPVLVPPEAEQRRIVSKVEGLMSLCDTLESQRRARISVRERASRSVLASLTSAPAKAESSGAKVAKGETLQSSWQRLSDHFEVLLDQPSGPADLKRPIIQLAIQGLLVPHEKSPPSPPDEIAKFNNGEGPAMKSGRKKAETLPPIADDEIPYQLPDGWSWVRLGNLIEIQGGSQPPKSKFIYEPREGYTRLVQIRDFKSSANLTFVPNEDANRPFCEDDVMIGRYGPPVFQILRGLSGTYNVALMKAEPRAKNLILNDYLFWLLQEPRIQDRVIEASERTAGQSGVRKELLHMFVVGVPPKAEQKRIVSKVSVLLSQLDELSTEMRSRQSTTDALLTALIHQILKGTNGDGQ